MARISGDVQRNPVTPAWAWAVAGLCLLLLAPMVLQRGQLLRRTTPLQVAGTSITPNASHSQRSQPQHLGRRRTGWPAAGWSLAAGAPGTAGASRGATRAAAASAAGAEAAGPALAPLDATPGLAGSVSRSGTAGDLVAFAARVYTPRPALAAGKFSWVVSRHWTRSSAAPVVYWSWRARPARPGTGWRTAWPRPTTRHVVVPKPVVRYRIPQLPPGWRVRWRPNRWAGYAYYFFHRG